MVYMEMNTLCLKIDEQNVIADLHQAEESLEREQELALDFSAVSRIDSPALRAMQAIATRADENKSKVSLRSVNVNVYKTLKLARLTRCFAFVN
jgi:anti-anti-sigma regulatory factor